MSPLTDGTSYWVETTPQTSYPALEHDLRVDVCVVGGGLTGLLTAWRLLQAGRSVALLERGRIGMAVTGFTTSKLTSQHGLKYSHLSDRFGDEAAHVYGDANERAKRWIVECARELDIEADIEQRAAYVYSCEPAATDRMRREFEIAAQAGLPAAFTTDVPLPFPAVSAVRFDDQAQFHPRKLVLGIAAAFVAGGGVILEQTKATGIEGGSPCTVRTEQGASVTAANVVASSLIPTGGVGSSLFPAMYCHQGYAVALPVDEDPLPTGVFINYERPMRSLRTIAGNGKRWVQVGGSAQVADPNGGNSPWDELEGWGRERFAIVEGERFRWTTQDYSTADGVPIIGALGDEAPGVFVATGFGGWGLTTAGVAAELICESICEGAREWHGLFDPQREVGTADTKVVSAHTAMGRDDDGERELAELGTGKAAVVEIDGEQVAAFRDDDGTLHRVSAVCTHLRCIVLWDRDERAWECPCHGSQFAPDGSVLKGPAEEPLGAR